MKKIFIALFLVGVVTMLGACGKAANPVPYPESGYPHTYPYNR